MQVPYCTPNASFCYENISKESYDCKETCRGINADIRNTDTSEYDETLKDLAAFTTFVGESIL